MGEDACEQQEDARGRINNKIYKINYELLNFSKQQSTTCGWRRARDAGGMEGVMEVTPFARISKFGWLAALCCYKLLPTPLLGPKSTKINSNNNQPVGGDVRGARGTSEGHRSDPLHPLSGVGQAAAPGGLRRPKHPPGPKKEQNRALTTIKSWGRTRVSSRRTPGGV